MQDLEKNRREIQKLKGEISNHINFISNNEFIDKETKADQAVINDKNEKLKDIIKNFNEIVAADKNKTEEFIDFHKNLILKIKNLHTTQLADDITYTKEKLVLIDEIIKGWNNFTNTGVLPDTFKIAEYDLFADIVEFEKSFDYKNIDYETIAKLEKIRQEIMDLSIEQFQNDTLSDKGKAWGASPEMIANAEKNYSIIAKKITDNDKKLRKLISETDKNTLLQWVLFHLYTCAYIINVMLVKNARNTDSTRLMVATETFYEWKDILSKDKKYFIPNVYYLSNYDKYFNFVFNSLQT